MRREAGKHSGLDQGEGGGEGGGEEGEVRSTDILRLVHRVVSPCFTVTQEGYTIIFRIFGVRKSVKSSFFFVLSSKFMNDIRDYSCVCL